MKKKYHKYTILNFIFFVFFMGSLSINSYANNMSKEKNKIETSVELSVKDQLSKAKTNGNAIFLVITSTNAKGVPELIKLAKQANKKVKKSTVIVMDRDNIENKELVVKYSASNIPVPYIVVLSPNGIPVGGYPATQATEELLIKLVPSPKYNQVLVALDAKKPIFIIVSKETFTDKSNVLSVCKTALNNVSSAPLIIEIDINDVKEENFLKQIGVNLLSTSTVTVVINSTGNITGVFTGVQPVKTLTDAATKVIKKGCCPSGSSSGC